jgi:hypothetical protein
MEEQVRESDVLGVLEGCARDSMSVAFETA